MVGGVERGVGLDRFRGEPCVYQRGICRKGGGHRQKDNLKGRRELMHVYVNIRGILVYFYILRKK